MKLLAQGESEEETFERTRTTTGVQDADLAIRKGEFFVVAGLSTGSIDIMRMSWQPDACEDYVNNIGDRLVNPGLRHTPASAGRFPTTSRRMD